MSDSGRCIYRGCQFDPSSGEGDHVFPAALGEFSNLRRFRGVCPACNNEIGKSEAQLLRCGPEAYMSRLANPPQRRARQGKAWRPAMGAPPPTMYTERNGARMIVRPVDGDPRNIEAIDQLVVIDAEGKQYQIPLYAGMSADAIRTKIKERGITGRIKIHFLVSEQNGEWFDGIADSLWPQADRTEFPAMEIGTERVQGQVSFTVNDHYFRALAKIAFHYYLCYNESEVRGCEPEFADLRRFILEGGAIDPFFSTPRTSPIYFGVPFGEAIGGGGLSPAHWCHLLAADDTQRHIVVYMQLFIGLGYVTPPHYVILGPSPRNLRGPGAWVHMLAWEPGASEKGIVTPKGIVRGKRPETIIGPRFDTTDAANPFYTDYRTNGPIADYRVRPPDT